MSDEGSRLRPADRFSFTPRAKKVLESGKDAAESLGHDYIGTEPILEKSGLDPQLLRHESGVDRLRAAREAPLVGRLGSCARIRPRVSRLRRRPARRLADLGLSATAAAPRFAFRA